MSPDARIPSVADTPNANKDGSMDRKMSNSRAPNLGKLKKRIAELEKENKVLD